MLSPKLGVRASGKHLVVRARLFPQMNEDATFLGNNFFVPTYFCLYGIYIFSWGHVKKMYACDFLRENGKICLRVYRRPGIRRMIEFGLFDFRACGLRALLRHLIFLPQF